MGPKNIDAGECFHKEKWEEWKLQKKCILELIWHLGLAQTHGENLNFFQMSRIRKISPIMFLASRYHKSGNFLWVCWQRWGLAVPAGYPGRHVPLTWPQRSGHRSSSMLKFEYGGESPTQEHSGKSCNKFLDFILFWWYFNQCTQQWLLVDECLSKSPNIGNEITKVNEWADNRQLGGIITSWHT